jgi:hypothetical protein
LPPAPTIRLDTATLSARATFVAEAGAVLSGEAYRTRRAEFDLAVARTLLARSL